jgi:RNA 3'-phosphate cyclase
LIEVDGSEGEGGGQILRTAVALSALTGNEVLVSGIRSKRERPGLQPQHLCAVKGVAGLCDAKMRGAFVGSGQLEFSPGRIKGGNHRMAVGTAGSVTLVLQACMLASACGQERMSFEVTGGTNVRWSPPIDFYRMVLFPCLARMGGSASLIELVRGFYPEGGGKIVVAWRPPPTFQPLSIMERGEFESISGCVFVQGLPQHIGKRMAAEVRKGFLDHKISIESEYSQGSSKGAGVFLAADFANCYLSGDSLGERGLPAEKVGERAVDSLKAELGSVSTIDVHSSDQLLPYMCLAHAPSSFLVKEVTGHLSTQAGLLRRFLGADVSFTPMEKGTRVDVRPSRTCS